MHLPTTILLLLTIFCSTIHAQDPTASQNLQDPDLISAAASDYFAATSLIASLFSSATGPIDSVYAQATSGVASIFADASSLVSSVGSEGSSVWSKVTATNTQGPETGTQNTITVSKVEETKTVATGSAAASTSESEATKARRNMKSADGVLFAAIFAAVAYL